MLCKCEILLWTLHGMFHIDGLEGQRAPTQFRNIERLEAVVIELGIALWQHKGLLHLSILVYVAEIRFSI